MTDIQKFAKAFELWENDYRTNIDEYMTDLESLACEVSELSIRRAEHFNQLLKEISE